jgi:uncharacterized protein YjiS (DUF1127 family)
MNMFQFAIASIVDANTGNGLVYGNGKLDYAAFESHGRKIRTKSIVALFASIGSRVGEVIASYRATAKQRRDLRALTNLNDHLLDDIGLSRGDLHSVRMGAVTLDELNANYSSARRSERINQKGFSVSDQVNHELEASNEQLFDTRKYA